MIRFQKFKVKDIVFLAIMAAVLLLAGAVTMPLMISASLFGLRNLATAPFYGLLCAVALMKVPKPGALTLVGVFNGAVLLMMSPAMFLSNAAGALICELVILLIFRDYKSPKSILLSAGLFIPFTVPLSIPFLMLLNGTTFAETIGSPGTAGLVTLGTVVLGIVGALLGMKTGRELQKAGKLKA